MKRAALGKSMSRPRDFIPVPVPASTLDPVPVPALAPNPDRERSIMSLRKSRKRSQSGWRDGFLRRKAVGATLAPY